MRVQILVAMGCAIVSLTVHGDEKLAVLTVGGETYTNVTVTTVSATDIFFTHAGGMANAKLKDLPPDLQTHFHFDAQKAGEAERRQTENQAKFQAALARQPAVHGLDMTRPAEARPVGTDPAEGVWRNYYSGELKQAEAEGKLVLLDFTGSDWCPWCIKFDRDVLSTSKFAAYAGQKLELVKVDFPHHAPLPEEQRRANEALQKQFGVNGFPTYVLLNSAGKELGRQVGYKKGGPDAFIAELEKFGGQ